MNKFDETIVCSYFYIRRVKCMVFYVETQVEAVIVIC